jgi:hypothetical protein
MKQSSIDWLEEQYYESEGKLTRHEFEQAKQMEKQQMKEAVLNDVTTNEALRKIFENQFEHYYNETYDTNTTTTN